MKILFLGDIVGRTGRIAIKKILPEVNSKYSIDLIIANGENSAGGFGITRRVADELFSYGISILTMGNHTWDNKTLLDFIDKEKRIIRPLNYNYNAPGRGWTTITYNDKNFTFINLIGQVFLQGNNSPFSAFDNNIKKIKSVSDYIFIDFHGEATAEKLAFANYVDGLVTGVFGTHTHVQTSDESILPDGTAYITDLGMCGADDSILGMSKDRVIQRFRTQIPVRYKVARGVRKVEGVIINLNENKKVVDNILRIRIKDK